MLKMTQAVADEDKVVTTNWIITNEGTDDEFNYTVKDRNRGSVVAEGIVHLHYC